MLRSIAYYTLPLVLIALLLLGESLGDLAADWAMTTPYGWVVLLVGAAGMIPLAIRWGKFFELESQRREWRKSLGNPTVIMPNGKIFRLR